MTKCVETQQYWLSSPARVLPAIFIKVLMHKWRRVSNRSLRKHSLVQEAGYMEADKHVVGF
jgi:hypothetical protein